MGKQLHLDPAAEKEATAVGRRFMNSTDVVGDMSRAYGADLSSVRIHTDESAARRAAERGVDAYSTGKDVFFGQGAFDRSDPASRGLLAHELSHSLQQGVGGGDMGGLAQSAPMGAEQGGIISWFRNRRAKKQEEEARRREIEEMTLSQPKLIRSTNDAVMESGPIASSNESGMRFFMNYRSQVLNQMIEGASREQLQNDAVRRVVQENYNTNMNKLMRSYNGKTPSEMDREAFRKNTGELNSLGRVLESFLPEDFSDQVINAYDEKGTGRLRTDNATKFIADTMEQNEPLMDYLGGLAPSFDGVDGYADDPYAQSEKMINTFMLKVVNSNIVKSGNVENMKKSKEIQKVLGGDGNELAKKNGHYHAIRLRNLLTKRFQR